MEQELAGIISEQLPEVPPEEILGDKESVEDQPIIGMIRINDYLYIYIFGLLHTCYI